MSIYAIDPSLLNQRRGLESDASTQNTFGPAGSALASPLVRGAFDGLRDSMRNAGLCHRRQGIDLLHRPALGVP